MPLYRLGARSPSLPADDDYWIAPNATLIGDVRLAAAASIWFACVLRGDEETISIGPGSNVQDGCIFHADPGFPLTLGENCSVGHAAVLHGCTIGDNSLVGMGAILLNGVRLGRNCLVGAHAFIPTGKVFPDNSVILGSPGKVARQLDEAGARGLLRTAEGYVRRWRRYRAEFTELV